jgi:hypothetical protein
MGIGRLRQLPEENVPVQEPSGDHPLSEKRRQFGPAVHNSLGVVSRHATSERSGSRGFHGFLYIDDAKLVFVLAADAEQYGVST